MFQSNDAGAGARPVSPGSSPRFEDITHSIKGSLAALQKVVKTLHKLRYAEPNDWSKPQFDAQTGKWVIVLIKRSQLS
ncbi:MAG: hypothetical protein F6J97_07980 [Leptolyngbya sp. SIO4C1]|nr:hypothetical protein [Leptolyngbya sp. SIO4C1]